MNIEQLPTASLTPYARNSRTHSAEQVAQITASIREFGFTNPVLVDGDGGIIAGHGRVMAATAMGLAAVPCLRLAHLSDAQKRAYIIADNKLAMNAGWDAEMLALELRDLHGMDFDMSLMGFGSDELADLLFEEPVPHAAADDVPAVQAVAVSRPGDLWVLGNHRILCGDSTDLVAMHLLMAGKKADACWTDPPYNIAYETKAGKIDNDDLSDADFRKFLDGFYRTAAAVMRPGASIYVAHSEAERVNFTQAFLTAGFKLSGVVIWRKDQLVLGRSDYQWIHEPILYGWKTGGGAQVFRGQSPDHRQRHRCVRLAVHPAPGRKVADHPWRGNHDC